MKKRILTSSLIIVIFALFIVTFSFITLIDIKELERTKNYLGIYNNIIINNNLYNKNLDEFYIDKFKVRFTLVDNEGNVVMDSYNKELENHANREEILEAFKLVKLEGFAIIASIYFVRKKLLYSPSVFEKTKSSISFIKFVLFVSFDSSATFFKILT